VKFRCMIIAMVTVFVFAGCIGSAIAASGDIATDTVKADPNIIGPRIEFESIAHDFGDITPGTENICKFKFKNIGSELLKIEKVTKSCGCTPFELKKTEYAPGEQGELKVKYNHSGKAAGNEAGIGSKSQHNRVKRLPRPERSSLADKSPVACR